jgi:hypothetical protein
MTPLKSWKPWTTRRGLLLAAGITWGGAGVLLLVRGYLFLPDTTGDHIVLGNLALFLGILFFRFMFSSLTEKNIARIKNLAIARPCLFSFQTWRSYGIMTFMIATGITVRSMGLIAPAGIGTVYLTMSIPLIVSSARLLREGVRYQ